METSPGQPSSFYVNSSTVHEENDPLLKYYRALNGPTTDMVANFWGNQEKILWEVNNETQHQGATITFEFTNNPRFSRKFEDSEADAGHSNDSTELDPSVSSKLRRRAQNRASQRAFRDRKEKHIRQLKQQIRNLSQRHGILVESSARQTALLVVLRNRMAELEDQLRAAVDAQRSNIISFDDFNPNLSSDFGTEDDFDAFTLMPIEQSVENDLISTENTTHGLLLSNLDPYMPAMGHPRDN